MSKKRTDRTAAAGSNDDDEDEKQQPDSKNARLTSDHTAASAAAASSSSTAAVPAMPSRSSAQRLYPDALLSVFRFLRLADLLSAHASCRSWRDAAHKEPSRQIVLGCRPGELSRFASSPLRHHVGEYSARQEVSQVTLEQFASLRAFPALSRVTIAVPSAVFTPLIALRGQAGYAEAIAATVAAWPPKLTQVEFLPQALSQAQVLIDCIGQLAALTELALWLPDCCSIQPLLQLTLLQSLKLEGQYSLDNALCGILKQMGSLRRLNVASAAMSLETLQSLCAPPTSAGIAGAPRFPR